MPSRIHTAPKRAGELWATLARLAAQGDTITHVIDTGTEWLIVTERHRTRIETRVEQPDTRGNAEREVRA